jgi:hypothetical protein
MVVTTLAGGLAPGLLEDTLDELEVTDRVFRALRYSLPLNRELAQRVLEGNPGRVLLVGLDGLLAEALRRAGIECEVADLEWRAAQDPQVTSSGNGHAPSTGGKRLYDTIVVAFPTHPENPARLLWRLSDRLAEDGRLVVAIRQPGQLRRRLLRAGAGRPRVTMSAPAAERFTLAGLATWCRAAGMKATEATFVVAEEAWPSGKPLTVAAWLGAAVAHTASRALPGFRDCLLLTITRQVAGPGAAGLGQRASG